MVFIEIVTVIEFVTRYTNVIRGLEVFFTGFFLEIVKENGERELEKERVINSKCQRKMKMSNEYKCEVKMGRNCTVLWQQNISVVLKWG
jgi:hypothetical protein